MLDGQFETDDALKVDHPEVGHGTGRRTPSPGSPESLLVEVWERRQSTRLGPRERQFLARPEVRELASCSTYHLEEGAKFAIRRNPHHHLLLAEWLNEVRTIQAAEQRSRDRAPGETTKPTPRP